eukprot:TRINITY_DN849_c0_g1_i2.p1 TRINITY_DN849_c0_g1~~TRINITY_DN849_c0_g1_i2.p1  ORF type:complete len:143 (+),score=17.41 TRINITY_DN849_c0_g1_i2:238-666(+)
MTQQTNINVNVLNGVNWHGNINKFAPAIRSKKAQVNTIRFNDSKWRKTHTESWNDCSAMPIIVYENNNGIGFKYWIEWVKFIYIECMRSYIGVSFKYNANVWNLQGIYLDKGDMYNKYRLCGLEQSDYIFDFSTSITQIQWL